MLHELRVYPRPGIRHRDCVLSLFAPRKSLSLANRSNDTTRITVTLGTWHRLVSQTDGYRDVLVSPDGRIKIDGRTREVRKLRSVLGPVSRWHRGHLIYSSKFIADSNIA